jgi:DNA-directed RNA polymerase specialized sigma24 family protein
MPWDDYARADFDDAFGNLVAVACHVAERFFRYDPEGIGDVVAETMARTYARWERVQRSGNSVVWVIGCAKDVCLEQLRARAESHIREVGDPHISVSICDALDRLPRAQRDVAALRFMMDCDDATTALALNLPAKRTDALAEKARKRMGNLLIEVYKPPDEAVA